MMSHSQVNLNHKELSENLVDGQCLNAYLVKNIYSGISYISSIKYQVPATKMAHQKLISVYRVRRFKISLV